MPILKLYQVTYLVLNDLQVLSSSVMRIQDEELEVAGHIVEVHTQNGVRQNTTT